MEARVPEKWDKQADAVIVGYGGAGATAAIAAHGAGARVIVLEKMPTGGGNTRVAGGTILNPTGMEFVNYVEAICYRTVGREMIEAFVENAMKNGEWINQIGGNTQVHASLPVTFPSPSGKASFPWVPSSEFMVKYTVAGSERGGTNAERLWQLLSGYVERRGIEVLTNTPARELIRDPRGEVIGVIAEMMGQAVSIQARRAVILTCGGFEYDEAMKWDFLPGKPFYAYGNPGNTGDGIRMAQKVGASIWHMAAVSASLGFKAPEYQAAFSIRFVGEGFIYVDKEGRRFENETSVEFHEGWRAVSIFDPQRLDYPRIPAYAIFDETTRRKGPLWGGNTGANQSLYRWSPDNLAEVARGWIVQGKTVAELASRIPLDGTSLENTLARYNEFCKSGQDSDFGRSRETLVPLRPPYYAISLWPCLLNTQGGPRRDKEARVLDPEGRPIPRLYAAGELGSIWGFLYQGSGNIGECLAIGRIAGRNAAAEKPWA